MKQLKDIAIEGKRVLIRVDFNVPISDGEVTSRARIHAVVPTINYALEQGATVLLMSHLGRPVEGHLDAKDSLAPVADCLSSIIDRPVRLVSDYLAGDLSVADGEILMLENVRCNVGEKANADDLAQVYASLCDVFVMDAFATAHRAQASTHGVAKFAPIACAGPLLAQEIDALEQSLKAPKRPMVAIVGGAKVSTKLTVLEALSDTVDQLIPGGGIANTFIAASGYNVGKSLYEPDLLDEARRLMSMLESQGKSIPIPVDVVVGKAFAEDTPATTKRLEEIDSDDMIFDIGPETVKQYNALLSQAGTIVWNGPVGVFEFAAFASGTQGIGESIRQSTAFSLAGGGDTLAAIDAFGLADDISYISTGGGAFLEFMEGKLLPAIEILNERA